MVAFLVDMTAKFLALSEWNAIRKIKSRGAIGFRRGGVSGVPFVQPDRTTMARHHRVTDGIGTWGTAIVIVAE